MDIEKFKRDIWIPEARLKFNMTEIDALQTLESIVEKLELVKTNLIYESVDIILCEGDTKRNDSINSKFE